MNKNKKKITITIISLFIISIVFAISAYAYYNANVYKYGTFEVDIHSKGVDELKMDSGSISLIASAGNFGYQNGQNVSDNAYTVVSLKTSKESAEYCYNINLKLPDEEIFEYTSGKCYDENNNEVSLSSLGIEDDISHSSEYLCVNKGYTWDGTAVPELVFSLEKSYDNINYDVVIDNLDITTKTGTIPISDSDGNTVFHIKSYRNITTTNYYRTTVTLVYLKNVNQEDNNHKSYHAVLETVLTDC